MSLTVLQRRLHVRRMWQAVLALLLAVVVADLLPMIPAVGALYETAHQPQLTEPEGLHGFYYETVLQEIPYDTLYEPDYTLAKGQSEVRQEGRNGVATFVVEAAYAEGEWLGSELRQESLEPAVPEIIGVGALVPCSDAQQYAGVGIQSVISNEDGSGYLILSNGDSLHFSGSKAVTCTAYTAGVGRVGTRTASGTTVRRGVAAVDRSVIPLGTKMFVTSNGYTYGVATAEDTGVKGNTVDLYMNSYAECMRFGRRSSTVFFLD